MSQLEKINPGRLESASMSTQQANSKEPSSGFGQVLADVADGALEGVAAVAPFFPGGQLIKMAANGLRGLTGTAPAGLGEARGDKLDQMWKMQEQNQMFNLQYMHLQQKMQADNRHFSTMSNLLKARHDTAKAAINNMRV